MFSNEAENGAVRCDSRYGPYDMIHFVGGSFLSGNVSSNENRVFCLECMILLNIIYGNFTLYELPDISISEKARG